jgi:drug/metabolite transporter (DMT)-like permease
MSQTSARGVFAMFVAVAAFSFMDALLKMFATHYPALQVSAIRALASLPFVVAPLAWGGRLAELLPGRPLLHLLRGILGVVMLSTFIFALREQSMAEVYSIYMAAPLLIVLLASMLLGERVDLGRWLAIGVGLAGVMVILRPSSSGLQWLAGLAAVASALCYAIAAVTARLLTRTDRSASMVFSFLAIVAIVCGAFAAPDWVAIQPAHWSWIAGVGLLGTVGQHYITEAFRFAPASTVAPIEYTALLWGMGIDWVFWSSSPSATMLAGAALVIGAGLYVAWRERSP